MRIIAAIMLTFFITGCAVKKQTPHLFLHDNFNTLDKETWQFSSHTFSNNLAQFNPDNVSLNDGKLVLKMKADSLSPKSFSSAEVRTVKSFKYGKFSARIKGIKGNGIINGFFLYRPSAKTNQEIDVELMGRDSSTITLNHWINDQSNGEDIQVDFDTSAGFHEYTITWLPGEIRWEIDGKEVYRTTESVPSRRMKLIFNIWPSKTNGWAGEFDPKVLPCRDEIDDVKIFTFR